jgi:hypothetical protein
MLRDKVLLAMSKHGAGKHNQLDHDATPDYDAPEKKSTGRKKKQPSMFHGTSADLAEKIKTEGLRIVPNPSGNREIWASKKEKDVLGYAAMKAFNKDLKEFIVIEFKSETMKTTDRDKNYFYSQQDIPPENIVSIKVYSFDLKDEDSKVKNIKLARTIKTETYFTYALADER